MIDLNYLKNKNLSFYQDLFESKRERIEYQVDFIKLKIGKRIETLKNELDILNIKFQEKLEILKEDILR